MRHMQFMHIDSLGNIKLAQEKGDPKDNPLPSKTQPGDTVLVQNHVKRPFDPKYIGNYRVVSLKGNQVVMFNLKEEPPLNRCLRNCP